MEIWKGTSAIEFSGVVKAVAKDVRDVQPGDRVCALPPNSFRMTERVPNWACHKLFPDESFEVMPTLPVIYGTALYALDDRAHLRAGEVSHTSSSPIDMLRLTMFVQTILVHSRAGAFGQASLVIALQRGATVYVTVSTEDKKDFLINKLGMPRENIF